MTEGIAPSRFHELGWRVLRGDACTYFATGSLAAGIALVDAIGKVADGQTRPRIDIRPEGVTVRLASDAERFEDRDLEMARRISETAGAAGMKVDLSGLQIVQIAIDALVIPDVLPFWRAVLGYDEVDEADLVDRRSAGPPFWFQQMDAARPQRNRIHIDVYVAQDEAEARVAAALAAGGHIVNDEKAPYWWTLADAEGNEADIAPWPDQD